jgi:hypothetical protein
VLLHPGHLTRTGNTPLRGRTAKPLRQALGASDIVITPKALIQLWVESFNNADAATLSTYYAENAVNHQVAESEVRGRDAIRETFEKEFSSTEMVCIVENIFEDGEWGILEWKDPLGLRGCGFFHVIEGKIHYQRGYWDKLSFLRQHGLPIPHE